MSRERWDDTKSALGYLASIALVVGALVWGLPHLIGRMPNIVLAILALALVAPLIGVVALVLQGRLDPRPLSVWRAYLLDLVALFFELLFIVLIVPVIAFQLVMILGGVFGAALLIGLFGFALQELLGFDLQIAIGWRDAIAYTRILIGVVLGEALLYALYKALNSKGENLVDSFVDLNQSVLERLRPHAQPDLKGWRKRRR